jgi:hypothetical protein
MTSPPATIVTLRTASRLYTFSTTTARQLCPRRLHMRECRLCKRVVKETLIEGTEPVGVKENNLLTRLMQILFLLGLKSVAIGMNYMRTERRCQVAVNALRWASKLLSRGWPYVSGRLLFVMECSPCVLLSWLCCHMPFGCWMVVLS